MRSYIASSGSCLFEKNAPGNPLPVPDKNPGDIFDIQMYCVKVHGPGSTPIVEDTMCDKIWRRWTGPCDPPNEDMTCNWIGTEYQNAADGAPCGDVDEGKHCFLGKCVTDAELPTTITTTVAPSTTTTARSTTTPIPGFTCTVAGTFAYPLDCAKYMRCVAIMESLYPYLYTCPAKHVFNLSRSLCVIGIC
ncbi:A disintegrin and metalloproteinase with thrombospondin motifs 15 [Folsomia candida]|nr:A disintegrin and metalloproteinase with thrombospondin motifs 15 [Folsomia candida]